MVTTAKPKPKPGEPKKKPGAKPRRGGVIRIKREIEYDEYAKLLFSLGIDIVGRTIVLNSVYSSEGGDEESGTDAHLFERCLESFILFEQSDPKKPIKIALSTYGGHYYYGMAIHDCIKNSSCPTTIYGYGPVMSMGAVIAAAADKFFVSKHVTVMLHFLRGEIDMYDNMGTSSHAEHLRGDEYLLDIFVDSARRRGKTIDREELRSKMKETLYLSAEQAVEMGLADGIITKP